ncbi:MAG TPA: acetyl-CoA carboxylase biotin carboxyl carrier protein subunit [Bacteroidales bacterium]|nr:acetyl-CoA carboxylase biotin carboxyl carrier protein subunit [Bacteroidales bacterium]
MALQKKKLYALGGKKKYSFNLPLTETIKIGKRHYKIMIKEDEKHGTYILWKNRRYPVEIIQSRQNKFEILFNYVSYSFTIETPFSLKRKKYLDNARGKIETEKIQAPMPGKIIEVLVREGSEISRGEPLLILEAMKMQNEINCPHSGVVTSVNVKNEINVMKDDVMIEIKIAK